MVCMKQNISYLSFLSSNVLQQWRKSVATIAVTKVYKLHYILHIGKKLLFSFIMNCTYKATLLKRSHYIFVDIGFISN